MAELITRLTPPPPQAWPPHLHHDPPPPPPPPRHVPGNMYKEKFGTDLDSATNELVMRIQPKEAIYLKINNKVVAAGLGA